MPKYIPSVFKPKVIEHGFCRCGCGQKTTIAKRNRLAEGIRKGDPMPYVRGHNRNCRPLQERFWEKVDKRAPHECWPWQASSVKGYGSINNGQNTLIGAHRLSWVIHNGPIPDGLEVCHKCDNPPCVNPNHLFLGTHTENVVDMYAKGRGARLPTKRGEDANGARLTADQVRDIRRRYANGEYQTHLAQEYGVKQATISLIIRRKTWVDVE